MGVITKMKNILIIILLLIMVVLIFVLWFDKTSKEKRFCSYCEEAFWGKRYKKYKPYCPNCGNKLKTMIEILEDEKDGE